MSHLHGCAEVINNITSCLTTLKQSQSWRQSHKSQTDLGLLGDVEVVDTAPGETRSRHPVAPVAADVIVLQQSLKPVGSHSPVNAHVQHQVAGYILAASVGHETYMRQHVVRYGSDNKPT